jgi:predicted urease superfamily metal-dependent hydrolase
LEASNTKRDIIERSICRLFGVHPVLLGYSEAAVLGNTNAIEQARKELREAVKPVQGLIQETMATMYGNSIDWTLSEYGIVNTQINMPNVPE